MRLLAVLAVLAMAMPVSAQRGGGAASPPSPPPPLEFQYMGPASNGRFAAVVGIPGDTTTYYLGAASGGVWKSTDGGRNWAPIFDDQPVQAIGALALARTNPNIVWAGTGEAWAIRDADVMGDGVYKSTDAGRTWTHMGLKETGRIGRIIVHPSNPEIVYVCALGRATGPQQERGVYKTTDGGRNWQRILFVDVNTGCSGLAMDASNPNVLFAGTWQVVMHTWAMFSGGPSSGVYVTRDGGASWTRLENGLPRPPVGKIDVAIAPSDSRRVYALIQTPNQGSLWRSDDGGNAWRVVSWDRRLIGRAGYYIRVTVNPKNADEVHVMNSSSHMSLDGGLTFPQGVGGCGDCHDQWIDPLNGDHWVTTGDNTAGITRTHGRAGGDGRPAYLSVTLPIGQMYHVAADHRTPYWIYSNRQDDGTMRGPSNAPLLVANVPAYWDDDGVGNGVRPPGTGGGGRGGAGGGRGGGGGGAASWQTSIGGCESGFTIPHPRDADIIWATCYGNKVTRFDNRLGRARSVPPWIHTLDSEPNKLKYRCHWTAPLAIDPFEEETVYYGCQVVFKTTDRGQTWSVISPDLSTRDPSRVVSSGGVIGDNLGQFYGEVVFAIAPSPIQPGLIWAGTNDGKIWYTTNRGGDWVDVTKNVTGLPEWGTIRRIEPSHFDAATAYIAVDFHMMDNREPYIYKTTDLGKTWTKIVGGLPTAHPLAYVMVVAENPNRKGMLFAGTGNGFYYTLDDGASWTQFKEGLPAAPVSWIVVQKTYHDVVVSTYGRGLFILRDITRLEQSDRVAQDGDFLFAPRPGIRLARSGSAEFLYQLRTVPSAPVVFEVLDARGQVVRTMQSQGARPGLNRITWDLRYESPQQIALRTVPPDNPHIWEEARFKGRDTRPIIHWGIGAPMRAGAIAAPGKFSVRMKVGGQTYSQPFDVVKDPTIPSSDADLVANTATQVRIVKDLNETVDLVNRLEVMRKQIEDQIKANQGNADVVQALRQLDQKMMDTELRLLSRTDLHSDDKWYVEAYKVYMNLVWLHGEVGLGASDMAGGAEYRPTDQSLQVLQMLETELGTARAEFNMLVERDLPTFNQRMAGKVAPITDRPIS